MDETPMFPLGTVLFPFVPLPVRIFEERYRIMLGRVLEADEPSFGVVLTAEGSEVGGGDTRHDIGTLAHITRVVAGADDIQLVAFGGRRLEVVRWLSDDPYPRAVTRLLDPLEWDPSLRGLHRDAERTVRRVLARAAEFGETRWASAIELADDPLASSWQLAAIAPVSEADQLAFLRSDSLETLLRTLVQRVSAAESRLVSATSDDELDRELRDLLGDG